MSYLQNRIRGMQYLLYLGLVGSVVLVVLFVVGMCIMSPMLAVMLSVAPFVENPVDEQAFEQQQRAHWENRVATLNRERAAVEAEIAELKSKPPTEQVERVEQLPADQHERAERMIVENHQGKITRLEGQLHRIDTDLEFAETRLADVEMSLDKISEPVEPERDED